MTSKTGNVVLAANRIIQSKRSVINLCTIQLSINTYQRRQSILYNIFKKKYINENETQEL